jgi:exodeoxyribonuclease V beta subunit
MAELKPLDLNGPISGGTQVLEASAGTGKTYALSHRLLRAVAEEAVPVETILVVTFTRAAAAEIRQRVRQRLNQAATGLAYRLAGAARGDPLAEGDSTLTALLNLWASRSDGYSLLLRLLRALDRLDLAPITTIHGFIQQLIRENSEQLGLDPLVKLQENSQELLNSLVTDWRRCQLSPAPAHWQAWVQSHGDLDTAGLRALAQLIDDDRDMLIAAPTAAPGLGSPCSHWLQLEQRFLSQLGREGAEASAVVAQLCKGGGNSSPVKDLGKKQLASLAEHTEAAHRLFEHWPAAEAARRYRLFCQGFATNQLRHCLADPDQAPTAGIHGLAERFCYEPVEKLLLQFSWDLRQGARHRRQQQNQLSFADLLELVDPARLPADSLAALRRWAQQRIQCCLIDEFQDTDPIQWRLFSSLFDGQVPLTLIGDPKQAIYRFRGGDIRTYRLATGAPGRQRACLNTNRRSDPALLAVLNKLFENGDAFGGSGISYAAVAAPEGVPASRLRQAPGQAAPPLRLRWLTAGKSSSSASQLRQQLAPQLASDLENSLNQGLELEDQGQWRAINASDLAVLVGRNSEALALQKELLVRGIPARIGRGGNVWESPEAASLDLALGALERQGHRPSAAALALSSIGGASASQLAQWDASAWGHCLGQLERARQRFGQLGPLPALEVLLSHGRGWAATDQRLSDLLQLAELLQEAWQEQGRPTAARLGLWLGHQRLQSFGGEASQQRLVARGAMVTLSTLHASKGLEFPLVWCPTLWQTDGGPKPEVPFRAWDPAEQRRCLELGRRDWTSPRQERLLEAQREAWQEQLRLGYVALTRAKHQLCIDWGRIDKSAASLPAWLLHPELRQPGAEQPWGAIAEAIKNSENLAQMVESRCGELGIQFELAVPGPALENAGETEQQQEKNPAQTPAPSQLPPPSGQRLLSPWGRWSYSRLVELSASPGVTERSGREEEGFDPDHSGPPEQAGPAETAEAESEAWAALPGGASFGTLVHSILEQLDYSADPAASEGQQILRTAVARSGLDPSLEGPLLPALVELLQRPLGGPLGSTSLASIARGDSVRELAFDLPISGFEGGPQRDILGEALEQLSRHPNPLLQSYAAQRLGPRRPQLSAGFLNGVIDLVFRHRSGSGATQWVVLDWKTNRLHKPVNSIMAAKDYWLQAQLYRQAVELWLRRRLGLAAAEPFAVQAVMLFTRSGEGAWLLDPGGQR